MKKTVISLMLMLAAVSLNAQVDTIYTYRDGVKEPTFFYCNFDWFHITKDIDERCEIRHHAYDHAPTYARYNYIDTSLRVIGVAAAMEIVADTGEPWSPNNYYVDTTIAGRVPEYLQLYKAVPGDLQLLAQKSWNDVQPRFRIQMISNAHGFGIIYPDVYEVYFDSAITVTDSFYVGATCYNNYRTRDSAGEWGAAHPETIIYEAIYYGQNQENLVSSKLTRKYTITYGDTHFDTLWHGRGDTTGIGYWMFIFPIFDTTGVVLDVQQPTRLAEQYTTLTPNPATTQASLFSSFRIHTVELYDTQGRLVGSRKVEDTQAQLDLTAYPKGLYMVVVTTAAGRTTKKLLIQ